ncbi:saccharopine dehydrogenase NADP-binding domain-containing protein [Antrihabitans sp. YC2-6]|uniref:saccharopine dehydrogenase family protein n=1 Tax=Antrihabitans sp. YC2-6 TaxID=2799498 RepID=UPI0027DADA2F|nr:saccharopine dehydrogenase NADP-binding domain-containing protein [Antrihabitans sp. YC2-6]
MTDNRIVLFGATGYTGKLTAAALVRRGEKPVLAGRNAGALASLSDELGGLPTAVADVAKPASVRALVGKGDVLLSTVGPFHRWGEPAAEAALDAGANYLDSTGEPAFIRRVFEKWDAPARSSGIAMLTAFGYDYVPGNLAAALALEEAGPAATSVVVGYFTRGGTSISKGTLTSAAQAALEPGFAWRGGAIRQEPVGRDLLRHPVESSRIRTSFSVSGTEHYSLPRVFPNVRDVRVGMGLGDVASPAMWAGTKITQPLLKIPGARSLARKAVVTTLRGSGGGPSDDFNTRSGCIVTAHAYAKDETELARVTLEGPSVYGFTAEVLAWGAQQLAADSVTGTGALGPVEAFGLERLRTACASFGLRAT